jgi:hypothetical protein
MKGGYRHRKMRPPSHSPTTKPVATEDNTASQPRQEKAMRTATTQLARYLGGIDTRKPVTVVVPKIRLLPFFGDNLPTYSIVGSHKFNITHIDSQNVQVTVTAAQI